MTKPILCLDFDGCIHDYTEGWKDGSIYGKVVPGFFDWAIAANRRFDLVVYSSRSKTEEGREAMQAWLTNHIISWDWTQSAEHHTNRLHAMFRFAHEKPPAFLTIDDRAMQFRGNWSAWWLEPERLAAFKPWSVSGASGMCEMARDATPVQDALENLIIAIEMGRNVNQMVAEAKAALPVDSPCWEPEPKPE